MSNSINIGTTDMNWMNEMTGEATDVAVKPPMNENTMLGLGILLGSIVLGLLGDALLRALPWGINVFLWVGTLVLLVIGLLEWQESKAKGEGRWLVVPLLFFAASLAWRASPTLVFLDIVMLLVTLALAALRTRSGQLRIAGIADYVWALINGGLNAGFGPLMLVFNNIKWKSIQKEGWTDQATAIGRGLLISLPLLFVFGGLFMAADPAFEDIVIDLFDLDMEEVFSHLFLFGFWTWISAGFLRQMLLESGDLTQKTERPSFLRLGIIESGIILGALNLLFLAFVLVQFSYFFGGIAVLERSSGLTYAVYARSGFFELVTVAALVLPLLLAGHWLLDTENPTHHRFFRFLAGSLIALLYVIMVSAVQRMRLYQIEFGMTELRLYTTAFMGWLGIVFAWFIATVLRGQRERFVFGGLISAFAVLAFLHLLNPDAFIVSTNVARQDALQPFDSRYVTTLSADAVPTLVNALSEMEEADRCQVAARILDDWTPPEEVDWRSWNWGRYRAWQIVKQNLGSLQTAACP